MKLPDIKISEEKHPSLHKICEEVIFPLSKEDKMMIKDMITYIEMSQIEEEREKFNLRAGVGLSAPQVNILKRFFILAEELEEPGKFKEYIVINPKIISESEELIYVAEGEGCLSINRPVEGIVPRNARITVEAYDIDGNKYRIRAREETAIAFQHEIDHLNGILFPEKIDSKDPYKNAKNMRAI